MKGESQSEALTDQVRGLLSRFGLSTTYGGPRGLIAGYPHDSVPEDLVAEWEEQFARFRGRLLAPLARILGTLTHRDPESVRRLIRERTRAAAAMADREMRRRYGRGAGTAPKIQPELAGPSRWH